MSDKKPSASIYRAIKRIHLISGNTITDGLFKDRFQGIDVMSSKRWTLMHLCTAVKAPNMQMRSQVDIISNCLCGACGVNARAAVSAPYTLKQLTCVSCHGPRL